MQRLLLQLMLVTQSMTNLPNIFVRHSIATYFLTRQSMIPTRMRKKKSKTIQPLLSAVANILIKSNANVVITNSTLLLKNANAQPLIIIGILAVVNG